MSKSDVRKPDGITWEAFASDLFMRNQLMATSAILTDEQFQKLAKQVEMLQGQLATAEASLRAEQERVRILNSEITKVGKAANERAEELAMYCFKHGIDPDTGEKKPGR